jgi:hypothetical protein
MRWPVVCLAVSLTWGIGALVASCQAGSQHDIGAGGASSSGNGTGTPSGTGSGSMSTAAGIFSDGPVFNDAPSGCTPKTCMELGVECGPTSDSCGDVIQCGDCKAPATCGGGGPFKCGTNGTCTPATCKSLGANCGTQGNGCNGTLMCGTCTLPEFCGGDGPNVCGPTDGGPGCVNLCQKQVQCDGGATTTLSGTVYAPNGVDPIYDAYVYVPNSPVLPFTPGVSCDNCGAAASGDPLVSATTGPNGQFQIQDVPVVANLPLVIQLGRWRIQTVIPQITACQDNPVPAAQTHLPQNQTQGDIPLMAMVTGNADPLECVLRKIGLDDSEFTLPAINGGSGRVQFFIGPGSDGPGSDVTNGGAPPEESLMTTATIDQYDMVIFACVGDEEDQQPADQSTVIDYANAGGRIFATHYSYVWLFDDQPFEGTATWSPNSFYSGLQTDPQTAFVDMSFPKGVAFATWLEDVGASPVPGQVQISTPRCDFIAVDSMEAQQWLYWVAPIFNTNVPFHYTFNTPVGSPPAQQCGRVLYSDFHVSGAPGAGAPFPTECDNNPMTPQEHILEFMLFDLASCVTPDVPVCTPLTCMQQGFTCGPEGDGCGNEIMCGSCPNGETCGGGGKPGTCGNNACVPTTCADQNVQCGPLGNGCGALLQCGTCASPEICGGGGMPGICGGGMAH